MGFFKTWPPVLLERNSFITLNIMRFKTKLKKIKVRQPSASLAISIMYIRTMSKRQSFLVRRKTKHTKMKNKLEPRGTSQNLLEPTRASWNQLELPKTINSTIKRWRQLVAVVAVSCSHASESFNSEILLVSSLSVNLRESCWTALLQSSFFALFLRFFFFFK